MLWKARQRSQESALPAEHQLLLEFCLPTRRLVLFWPFFWDFIRSITILFVNNCCLNGLEQHLFKVPVLKPFKELISEETGIKLGELAERMT